ncbi:tigger transposable element-derived protein 4-like [Ornithodoros turicata]|uniref:tigger transposable element-derived protein 4-like n=1 Tax=Ornithodoros turicata TaxID=34597 RepID=UPI0031392720
MVKHRVLKIKEKIDIIHTIERGAKKSALARERGLPLTTVCGVWYSREISRSFASTSVNRCRVRGSAFPDVEAAVVQWLKQARARNLPVSSPLLIEKAQCFALQLNHDDFVCSSGWLARFKARHSIKARVVSGEAAATDIDGAHDWKNGKLQEILGGYAPEDIFNMDESALFYRLLPHRTLAFRGEVCTGGKHAKERISVALWGQHDR